MSATHLLALALLLDPAASKNVDQVAVEALAKVPGKNAFLFTEITPEGPKQLFGLRADERFAVGSSFKLYILGELIDEVNAGRRRLDDTMLLSAAHIGPPSSELAAWPLGSPITLNTLALKMMSVSDNTATDHLLYLLGRETVEGRMAEMGHADPAVNRPLLSTRDMTMLRDKRTGMLGREYAKLDEAGKRAFLESRFSQPPNYDDLDFDTGAYDISEWYATPLDMARALAWIQARTGEDQPANLCRRVLAVDPKLTLDPKTWPFVGFKGGSEDQILAGNWLLKHRNGRWYTYHTFFNNPNGLVSPSEAVPVMMGILNAIEPTLPPK